MWRQGRKSGAGEIRSGASERKSGVSERKSGVSVTVMENVDVDVALQAAFFIF